MSLDPYKTLELDKNAGPEDVKKSYRRLARRYHPDVNQGDATAEEKFKEISMAYDILSDPAKKAEYDNLGREAFFERGFGGEGYRPNFEGDASQWNDILRELFGARSGGGTTGRRKRSSFQFGDLFGEEAGGFGGRTNQTKGKDREHELTLGFKDAVKGTELTLAVDAPSPCPSCGGQGVLSSGGGVRPCPECRGRGQITSRRTLKARIPPGVRDGQKIRLRGKGFPGERGGPPGDLNLIVKVTPDPVFTLDGERNLRLEQAVTLYQALLGGSVEVPTLDGRASLKIPEGCQNGAKFRLKGKGVKTERGTGDLIVAVKVTLPAKLGPEAKEAVKRLQELAPIEEASEA